MGLFKTNLLQYLLNTQTVSDIAGSRINWVNAPQSTGKPYVILQTTSGENFPDMDSASELSKLTIQIDCWATSWGQANALRRVIIHLLDGFTGAIYDSNVQGCFYKGESEEYDDDAKLFRVSIDFEITYTED